MTKPSYEELEQRIKFLENELERNASATSKARDLHLQTIINNTNTPIFIKDENSRYILINRKFEELTGLAQDQVIGKDDFAIFPESVACIFRKQDEQVKQENSLHEFTEVLDIAKGKSTFLTIKLPLHDYKGNIIGIAGISTDITQQLIARENLVQSNRKYRELVKKVSLGIQISDTNGRITLSNPAHHKILGYKNGSIIGKHVWDFMQDETDKERLKKYYSYIITHQPVPETYLSCNKTQDGQTIYIEIDWDYMRNADGDIYALCSIINDVTEKITTARALKISEKKVRNVIQSCPQGVMQFSLTSGNQLVLTDYNPAAEKILGIDCAQLTGKTIEEAFPMLVNSELPELYREVCRTGEPWKTDNFQYEDKQISGIFELYAFQSEPCKLVVFFSDITKKRYREEEIQKMQKLESVGLLAGGIAHDFNNLLTAILGNISLAKMIAQNGKNVFDCLDRVEKAVHRSKSLTQQLLTFAQGGTPVKTSGLIGDLIADSASFMLSGSNVNYTFSAPDNIWPVEMDEGQIGQVIQNVVKNADQSMPKGGTISIRIENITISPNDHIPLKEGRFVKIAITDNGIGIPDHQLARVFDPYFSTRENGSGLGLAASYSIIKEHNGLISLKSKQNEGSTFYIYLPAARNKPVPTKLPEETLHISNKKILVMDDDAIVLQVATKMLQLMGYETGIAHDGKEAIASLKTSLEQGEPFDAAILDLTIPGGMGGIETARELLNINPNLKTIISSGYANDPVMADYRPYGFQGVIVKPYSIEKLGETLHQLFK